MSVAELLGILSKNLSLAFRLNPVLSGILVALVLFIASLLWEFVKAAKPVVKAAKQSTFAQPKPAKTLKRKQSTSLEGREFTVTDNAIAFESAYSSCVLRRLRRGDVVEAAGETLQVDGYTMLPIKPKGAVQIDFLSGRIPLQTSTTDLRLQLMLSFDLAHKDFAPKYDFVYDSERVKRVRGDRGGAAYCPPAGWVKLGLQVMGRYESDSWMDSSAGWVVAYHGTRSQPHIIQSIVREGFKIRGGKQGPHNGAVHGEGVYCSPDAEYAMKYAKQQPLQTHEGDVVLVFQCRVRPETVVHTRQHLIWLVPRAEDIRPCAVLFGTTEFS